MLRIGISWAKKWLPSGIVLGALLLCVPNIGRAVPQAAPDIPPDAIPQIDQISPNQAPPNTDTTVIIHGSNFSAGAYVSSVSPAIIVKSSKRISATQLEAYLTISASAQPSTVSLLVSNPASRAAEAPFNIVAPPPTPAPEPRPPKADTPQPAAPRPPQPTPAPPAPTVQPGPAYSPAAPASAAPLVNLVEPARVGPGVDVDLKVTGEHFAQGSKVSFANAAIRVIGVQFISSTSLSVHIKVAGDASAGSSSLFVINPDDSEVEVPFAVTAKAVAKPPVAPLPPGAQRFDAFHLGNPTEVFQVHGKVKGALIISAGTVQYQEDGKTLVNIALSDIKDIRTSSVATPTFHITLKSGKTFHFAPASLRPADARNMVDAIRKSLPQQ